jgi:hypothetical protein
MMLRRYWNVDDVDQYLHLFYFCKFRVQIWNYLQIQRDPGTLLSRFLLRLDRGLAYLYLLIRWTF